MVSWKLKRPVSIDRFSEIIEAQAAEVEERTFDKIIAHIFRGWAYLEITFDYTNLFIINSFATDETRLPVSLKAKIAFYKRHFREVPNLQPYQDRALAIVEAANRLKVARHDIIHGIAIRETPTNIRRYLRHDYRGKKLIKQTKVYSLDEAKKTSSEMFALAKLNLALLREIGGTNLSKFFENPDG
jgi:hypothetical protein